MQSRSNQHHLDSDLQRDSLDQGGAADYRQFSQSQYPASTLPQPGSTDLQHEAHYGTAQTQPIQPRMHMDSDLQRDSLDRGGAGDFRQFIDQPSGAYQSGGHVTTVPVQQHSVIPSTSAGMMSSSSYASPQEKVGSVASGSAFDERSSMRTGEKLHAGTGASLDTEGGTLGERLKNAVVQTIHESQSGSIGNDPPPAHFQHQTAHVKLDRTYGSSSNPPDPLRDEDLESSKRSSNRKPRSNFELSEAGKVDIVPTDVHHTDMGTDRMGVPAKSGYSGGVGEHYSGDLSSVGTAPQEHWGLGSTSEYSEDVAGSRMRSGSEWNKGVFQDERHWTEKAADAIEDTKVKISESTHAAVNLAKARLGGHSDEYGK